MANIVNNLRVNGSEVKAIKIRLHGQSDWQSLKEFYYNGVLVWKNALPFIFTKDISSLNISSFGEGTMIFEGFGENQFLGSYSIVKDAEAEKDNIVEGQMVVETTEGDNNNA